MNAHNKTLDTLLKKIGRVESVHKEKFTAKDGAIYKGQYIDRLKGTLFSKYIFPEPKEEEMDTVLEETILNSVSACKEVENKRIEVAAHYGGKGVLFEVNDEGPGFDYKSIVAKRRATKIPAREILLAKDLDNGGHGIYSLMAFTDKFQYANKGTSVYFVFNLEKRKNIEIKK